MVKLLHHITSYLILSTFVSLCLLGSAFATDLKEIKDRGVLRHLGIPYANFVVSSGEGLDVELIKLFAQHLGVRYEYVEASWESVIGDLTGKKIKVKENDVEIINGVPVKGDIIANGLTILPWRKKIVDFSIPTFPSQVWIVARADYPLTPIVPNHDIQQDINSVRMMLRNQILLGKASTCLDPALYGLKETGARLKLFPGRLNDMVPAIIQGIADLTLLDVPDALVALQKFPGEIKIIGPITEEQLMGCAFAKNSPELREAFNHFFADIKKNGTYRTLVEKYYPKVFSYFHEFFGAR